jgi:hypothetical protein
MSTEAKRVPEVEEIPPCDTEEKKEQAELEKILAEQERKDAEAKIALVEVELVSAQLEVKTAQTAVTTAFSTPAPEDDLCAQRNLELARAKVARVEVDRKRAADARLEAVRHENEAAAKLVAIAQVEAEEKRMAAEVELLVRRMVQELNGNLCNTGNIARLVLIGMLTVKRVKRSGSQKKFMVLKAVKIMVERSNNTDEDKAILYIYIEECLPLQVDLLFDASQGVYNFGSKWCKSCCLC